MYITVNYSLNQTYNIHKNVFYQIALKSISRVKNFKVVINEQPIRIIISANGEKVIIQLDVYVKSTVENIPTKILELNNLINDYCTQILGFMPSNIEIKLEGAY